MQKTSVLLTSLVLGTLVSGCGESGGAGNQQPDSSESPIAIAIHGGAGTITRENMSAEREAQFTAALEQATEAGYEILEAGGDSMDAVIAAIQVMEDNSLFNAGIGAVYTYDGTHELDSSVMEGATMNAGAASGVKTVKSPIHLAREIMDNSRHVMLSADGAAQFAEEQGLELVDNSYFNSEHRYEQLQRALEQLRESEQTGDQIANNKNWDPAFNMGTVGAVALDRDGNLAAGTSTGGMTAKQYGRIGDSPIIGAGTWADNQSCAVSATGHGEYFIRHHVAADICSRVKYKGDDIFAAGDAVIHEVLVDAGGTGGVIILDAEGQIHMPFNTEGMYRASQSSHQPLRIGIYNDEE
ncbi:beta-aspartyl-peptidase [Aliidiomarina minuta]|uniref:Isoaspartyl peptidase n=1 Tax=Aliidiomarina minuta TaxID=880057 RepID=A0A432W6M0_9GAMM|nr:isoaspartyl peptidase/L-asparaginase [Aliidiomarina minuta]RUO25616.1 beta-aspartyl-peptidase [Aliidiomarina minuta]